MRVEKKNALLVSCLLILGCEAFDESKLPGMYSIEYEFGSERLLLREDGKYVQTVSVGGDTVVHSGAWQYDPEFRDVVLEHALVVHGGFGRLNPDWKIPFDGLVIRHLRRTFWLRPALDG